jgi:imidazolonepropionase-like amidohydrolase
VTILVQSFLNSATKLSTTATTATTVAQLKTLVNAIEGVSTAVMQFYVKDNNATTATVLVSGTLGSYGVTTATTIYSSNTISTATNKVDRQLAKLELAQLRKQAGGDTSATFYRSYNVYDVDLLADKYTSNTTTVGTTSTLSIHRPWTIT